MLIAVLLTAVSPSGQETTAAQYEPSQAPKPWVANSWHKRFVKYTPSTRRTACPAEAGSTYNQPSKLMHLQPLGRSNPIFSVGLIFTWLPDPRAGREGNEPLLARRGRAKALALLKRGCSETPGGCCSRGDNLQPSLHGGGPREADQACWPSNTGWRAPVRPQTRVFWLRK